MVLGLDESMHYIFRLRYFPTNSFPCFHVIDGLKWFLLSPYVLIYYFDLMVSICDFLVVDWDDADSMGSWNKGNMQAP